MLPSSVISQIYDLPHSNVIFMLAVAELSTNVATISLDSQANSTPSSTLALLGSTFSQISLNRWATASIAWVTFSKEAALMPTLLSP